MNQFRPGLPFTLFMIFGVAVTWSLMVWQFQRHQFKSALKAEILAGLEQPPLQEDALTGPVEALHYRKIAVRGTWRDPIALAAGRTPLTSEQIALPKAGYGVVQPLELPSGTLLLVDRGWIPREGAERALEIMPGTGDVVELQGQLRPLDGDPDAAATPGREGLPEIWPPGSWIALWERLPEPKVEAVVLAGEPLLAGEGAKNDGFPIDGYKPLPKMTDSLSYAGQWFLFGAILIVVWVAFGISRARKRVATPQTPTDAPPS